MAPKMVPKMDDATTFSYFTYITVPGPPHGGDGLSNLNKLWGYKDGNINKEVDGKFVPIGEEPEGLADAHRALIRHVQLKIKVTVDKMGNKTFEIM